MRAEEFNKRYPVGTEFVYKDASIRTDRHVQSRCTAINITPYLTTVLVQGMPWKNHFTGLDINQLKLNQCLCDFNSADLHLCPFTEHMHSDGKSGCNCCEFCTEQCKLPQMVN